MLEFKAVMVLTEITVITITVMYVVGKVMTKKLFYV